MAVDVVTETIIERPREVVAAFAADPDNVPKWYANIKSVEWKTPPPARVGSQVGFVAEFLGRRLAYVYEFAQFDPPNGLLMRTAEGPFPMETSYVWQDAGIGRTRMILRNRGEPRGFSAFLAPFMAGAMTRANRKDLDMLKSLLEADA